eukprot:7575429-Pyramimonas_sp.AAC.1
MCSASFSRAGESISCDLQRRGRPDQPALLRLKEQAVRLYQLAHGSHQRLSAALPYGPTPRPQDWTLARDIAECAAQAAIDKPAAFAWELLSKAWRIFSNRQELELESFQGVAAKHE